MLHILAQSFFKLTITIQRFLQKFYGLDVIFLVMILSTWVYWSLKVHYPILYFLCETSKKNNAVFIYYKFNGLNFIALVIFWKFGIWLTKYSKYLKFGQFCSTKLNQFINLFSKAVIQWMTTWLEKGNGAEKYQNCSLVVFCEPTFMRRNNDLILRDQRQAVFMPNHLIKLLYIKSRYKMSIVLYY